MPAMIVPNGIAEAGGVVIAECTSALFAIANQPGGDSRLFEMRILFDAMHRFSQTDDDALDEVVVREDCLWRAARAGNTGILRYLLRELQVDPNARRALLYARRHGRTEAVRILIAHGAIGQ